MEDTLLIVDDEELNRAILANGFKDKYNILEAANGREALELIAHHHEISAILLDLVMPVADGFVVLRELNASRLINTLPVFIVTGERNAESLMDAYNFGAVDVIAKPLMMNFLRCRVENVIELYRHKNELESLAREQFGKINSVNMEMIQTVAALIEFRDCDGESKEHVSRVCSLTEMFMHALCDNYPEYWLPDSEIKKIVTATVLHDIGKIAVPDEILSKPEKLNREEFDIMKLHTIRGCEILRKIGGILDKDVYDYCYDICRHHHERWDGKGYPDGLRGREISIWSQAVSLADVYDALTTERVYRPAYSHEKAVTLIKSGECGVFNPKLLNAFDIAMATR